jgi:hypothetical protein
MLKLKKWWIPITIGLFMLLFWMFYRARRRRDYTQIPLANAMKYMKTGDLLLFSGRNVNADTPQKWLRKTAFLGATYVYRAIDSCEFGHVAVVYKDNVTQNIYLIHCEMSSPERDVFAQQQVTGVQVTSLEERVRRYNGYCVWRPINVALDNGKILDFLKRTYHMAYYIPPDIVTRCLDRMTRAYRRRYPFDCLEPFDKKSNSFCTEYAGALLEECEVFDKNKGPYKMYYLPSDFTSRKIDRYLKGPYAYNNDGWELTL